jgi:hypothetical protein
MRNKRAIVVLLCTLSLPAPAFANGTGDMFGVMFRMMLTMMNLMADSMNSSNSWNALNTWNSPFNTYGLGSGGWPLVGGLYGLNGLSGWRTGGGWPGGFGTNPWASPFAANPWASPLGLNPFTGMGYGVPRRGGRPGVWSGYAHTSPLEGNWYGTSGEVLEVRGNRFILRNGVTSLAGALDINDSLVRMYTPQTGAVNVYQFARTESELLLEDPGGEQLVFYRRPFAAALPVRVF